MRNPNPNLNLHEFGVAWRFLTIVLFLLFCSSVDSLVVDSGRNHTLEWKVLTKRNFSSQIRLHQRVLIMVTIPWSGESRSLMKEVVHRASYGKEKLDNLKLMVVYKNKEKMLADALHATEITTIFFYYHSVSYKYQGRLRAQNILASVNYLMHFRPEELPLKSLNTPEELDTFLQSTDKAVLVLEFCGWSQKLLSKGKTNVTENAFLVEDASESGIIVERDLFGERNQTLATSVNKNLKVAGLKNERLTCGVENGLSENPLLGSYMSTNHSAPLRTESTDHDAGGSCSFEEFQRFESFFLKFTKFAQEFFLPPERRRFGLISERTLLPSLGFQDVDSWLLILHHAGCPNCSKIFEEGDDLKSVLQMHPSLITELESDGHDPESALPADKPSIILFVDRSSESSTTRRKSKEALETFRNFALHNQFSYQMALRNSITHGKHLFQSFDGVRSRTTSDPSVHPRKKFSRLAGIDAVKNKISVMIINEGGNVALDDISANAQDSSIHDILASLLQQKKKAKLSLLAKEVGFQLLSDDFEVKIADSQSPQTENGEANKLLPELPMEKATESSINLEDYIPNDASTSLVEPEEQTGLANLEPLQLMEEKLSYIVSNSKLIPQAQDEIVMNSVAGFAQDTKVEDRLSFFNELGVEGKHYGFDGFYFFVDGSYQLHRSLTSGSKIPSMIIIDPISEQHYVFPEEVFSYSSLCGFLDAFRNGSLVPYQRSEYSLTRAREAIWPPLINLDFHEVDPIPQVTIHTFSTMVLGSNESNTQNVNNAWMKDVLVLFSNNWCGFCQRMNLVVREVFRAFKGYMNILKSGSRKKESIFISDDMEGIPFTELPQIFLMDCTLNDCSLILKSMGQKELYPTLMLFPARNKNAITYHGDMTVTSVIKFIADHGSNSPHPSGGKGQDGNSYWISSEDASPPSIHMEDPVSEEKYNDVLLINTTPRREIETQKIGSHLSDDSPHVAVGTVLIATDKLLNVPPFDKTLILIVQADHAKGFQGLIMNKHISWDLFKGLEKGVEQVRQAPLSFGGPLILHEMPLVSLTRRVRKESNIEVLPNVYFLDQIATIREIEGIHTGTQSADDYWFFLGHSSWGSDQLFTEIAEGAWRISEDPLAQLHWPENRAI